MSIALNRWQIFICIPNAKGTNIFEHFLKKSSKSSSSASTKVLSSSSSLWSEVRKAPCWIFCENEGICLAYRAPANAVMQTKTKKDAMMPRFFNDNVPRCEQLTNIMPQS